MRLFTMLTLLSCVIFVSNSEACGRPFFAFFKCKGQVEQPQCQSQPQPQPQPVVPISTGHFNQHQPIAQFGVSSSFSTQPLQAGFSARFSLGGTGTCTNGSCGRR